VNTTIRQIEDKSIMMILLMSMAGILLSCSSGERNQQGSESETERSQDSIPFERPEISDLPVEVTEWVSVMQELQRGPVWHSYTHDDFVYFYIGWGEKPTGGYDVSVKSVEKSETGEIEINIGFISPSPDDMVTQVITYPYDLISYQGQDTDIVIQPAGSEAPRLILTITSDEPLQPVIAGSASIKLYEPAANDSVAPGFRVSGLASVFEATVNYRIYNSAGDILTESFTTASDGMNWGYFSFEPVFDKIPENGEEIILEVFNIDAKDGEQINDFRVPLIYSGNE
jgi:hypothetical protein